MDQRKTLNMSKSMVIDPNLNSYKTFFDHCWCQRIIESAERSALDEPVFHLCMAWRGAANTHSLPWLMVHNMQSFAEGLVRSQEPVAAKLVAALAGRLSAEMGKGLRSAQREQLDYAAPKDRR